MFVPISLAEEADILVRRARGHTYDRIKEDTKHANSTISRVVKNPNDAILYLAHKQAETQRLLDIANSQTKTLAFGVVLLFLCVCLAVFL